MSTRKHKALFILALLVMGGGGFLFTLNPISDRGLPAVPRECFDKASEYEQWLCLEPYLKTLVSKGSVRYAMDEVQRLQDEGSVNNCHFLIHVVGEANLEKHNFNPGKAFATCELGCAEGCFHGVMARYIDEKADPHTVASEVKSMCDTVSMGVREPGKAELRDAAGECAHGIGHGLAAHGFFSIPEATKLCQSFDNKYREGRCRQGIMMEHVTEHVTELLGLEEDELPKILSQICEPFREFSGEQKNWYQKCWDQALQWSPNSGDRQEQQPPRLHDP